MEIASIRNGLPAISRSRAAIDGTSSRQGGHQVAQKLTSVTFPFRSESLVSFPARSRTAKSGAALPSRAGCAVSLREQAVIVMIINSREIETIRFIFSV